MPWTKKRRTYAKKKQYSVIGKLEREEKIDDRFQLTMNRLTLEEIIAVKLELTAKSCGGSIYGLPIWHSIPHIVKDACLKFAMSATRTKLEAARFLGISVHDFKIYWDKFKPRHYFDDEIKKEEQEIKRY